MMMQSGGEDRSGAVDVRWILTILVISLAALAAGAALGLWLGS